MRTVISCSDAAQAMMKSLGFVGRYDVRYEGSRSTGYVGKPGDGDDVEVVVTIRKLPAIGEE
ncbi:hypothetical protein [Sphingomonas hankookensis]|uniref:hypothetical protein n=1 Tax=Sphingomonas hankookensis TaxID=563996 RepID=UPI003D303727